MKITTQKYTAIILAGGKSSRMGTQKALLNIHGNSLIENTVNSLKPYFSEIIISANCPQSFVFLGLPIVEDEIKDQGPLMGIYSSLKSSSNEINFVIASDIPIINVNFIKKLLLFSKDFDAVVPANNDKLEPLYAVYSKRVIPVIETVLQTKSRKISDVIKLCNTKILNTNMYSGYENLNTQHDLELFIKNHSA